MRHTLKFLAVAILAVAAAGCSNRYIDEAKSTQPRGTAFETALARDYLTFAKSESEYGDVSNTATFARRSTAAAEGKLVLPDNLAGRKISSGRSAKLLDARQRLVTALDANGRTTAPAIAARTQVLYDCWVEQVEENLQPDDIEACRSGFMKSLDQLEAANARAVGAPVESVDFLTFFNLGSAKLTAEAQQVVDQAVSAAKTGSDQPILITGFTDTTGTPAYNLRLSKQRAQAVADAMIAQGIAANRITTKGVGENDLLVPTGDGVAEPQNRRAQIAIGS